MCPPPGQGQAGWHGASVSGPWWYPLQGGALGTTKAPLVKARLGVIGMERSTHSEFEFGCHAERDADEEEDDDDDEDFDGEEGVSSMVHGWVFAAWRMVPRSYGNLPVP